MTHVNLSSPRRRRLLALAVAAGAAVTAAALEVAAGHGSHLTLLEGVLLVLLVAALVDLARGRREALHAKASAREALARSESRYRALVEATSAAVWTTTPDGFVAGPLPSWQRLTGSTAAAIQGTGWLDSIHPEDRDRTLRVWRQAVETGSFFQILHRVRIADGSYRIFAGRGAPVRNADGSIREWVGIHSDITERKQAEQELRELLARTAELHRAEQRSAQRTHALYELTAALSSTLTPEAAGRVVISQAAPTFGAAGGALLMLVPGEPVLEVVSYSGFSEDSMRGWTRYPLTSALPATDVVVSGTPIFLGTRDDWRARYPHQLPWVEQHDYLAYASLPLVFEGRTFGVITFNFVGERVFAPEERELMAAFAQQCAQALERARLYELERAARTEAERANRSKAEFLRAMSHDLRTPLTAIVGFTELVELGVQGPLTDKQRESMARIRMATDHLRTLINDVLSFARVETGRIEIHPRDVPVTELFDAVVPLIEPQIQAKGIDLVRAPFDPSITVRADVERTHQVLGNLLGNAYKFTRAGGTITLVCEPADSTVRLSVRDTGCGIAADQVGRIFEPFVQLQRPPELGVGHGVGLGLAISRELARAMGGELMVESEEGKGSVFTLVLPRPIVSVDPAEDLVGLLAAD